MLKVFSALAFSATVFFTGLAPAPARAEGEEVAAALLGLLAIYAVANRLDDDDDDDKHRSTKRKSSYHSHRGDWHEHAHRGRHDHGYGHITPVSRKYEKSRKRIPRTCVRSISGRNGTYAFATKRCLRKSNYNKRLHDRCKKTLRGRNGPVPIYGLRCLRNKGHLVQARR